MRMMTTLNFVFERCNHSLRVSYKFDLFIVLADKSDTMTIHVIGAGPSECSYPFIWREFVSALTGIRRYANALRNWYILFAFCASICNFFSCMHVKFHEYPFMMRFFLVGFVCIG